VNVNRQRAFDFWKVQGLCAEGQLREFAMGQSDAKSLCEVAPGNRDEANRGGFGRVGRENSQVVDEALKGRVAAADEDGIMVGSQKFFDDISGFAFAGRKIEMVVRETVEGAEVDPGLDSRFMDIGIETNIVEFEPAFCLLFSAVALAAHDALPVRV